MSNPYNDLKGRADDIREAKSDAERRAQQELNELWKPYDDLLHRNLTQLNEAMKWDGDLSYDNVYVVNTLEKYKLSGVMLQFGQDNEGRFPCAETLNVFMSRSTMVYAKDWHLNIVFEQRTYNMPSHYSVCEYYRGGFALGLVPRDFGDFVERELIRHFREAVDAFARKK